jgi:aryl-alcohol dehydrogenase-like predicted oxidoreductase
MNDEHKPSPASDHADMQHRRQFLTLSAGLAAASLLPCVPARAEAQARQPTSAATIGRRKLGKLEVSSVGLGVQNMSRTYQTTIPTRTEMHNIIRTAFDRGVTFFDAAEAYGPHEVERILGAGVAPFRDKVVIATKFGWNIDLETGERHPGTNSRPERIKLVVEGMLNRLRTDRIDLLYQHRVDAQVPIEDVAGAVKELKAQGKVLHWGLSEMGRDTLRRAHAELRVTAVQDEYSMLWRGPERWVLGMCEELGIGFVPWSPLGVGFLTGTIDAKTRFAPGDIRGCRVALLAGESAAQPRVRGIDQELGRRKKRHVRPDRPRLAVSSKAVDRAHSRHNADAAHDRKQRRGRGSIHARGTRRAKPVRRGHRNPRGAPPGCRAGLLGCRSAPEEISLRTSVIAAALLLFGADYS